MRNLDPRVGVAIAVIAVGLLAGVLVYSLTDSPADVTSGGSESTAVASAAVTAAGTDASAGAPTAPAAGDTGSGSAGTAAASALTGADSGSDGTDAPVRPSTPSSPATDDAWKGGTVSDPKSTLSIEQRKQCYYGLLEAEYRAIAEAEAAYPQEVEDADLDAHYELRFRLTDEYQAEVGKEYDLSFDGVVAVLVEGAENNWPVPPISE